MIKEINDFQRWVFKKADHNKVSVNFQEYMGGRWVSLGMPEYYSFEVFKEEFGDEETNKVLAQ